MKKKLYLHLGAHKTGTTFIQDLMRSSTSSLKKDGIYYDGLNTQREVFSKKIMRSKNEPDYTASEAHFSVIYKHWDKYILSDEDLLGRYFEFSEGRVYPFAGRNCSRLLKALPVDVDLTVFFSIRDYSDWLESNYLQWLKRVPQNASFESYLEGVDVSHISWPDVLREIKAALPQAKIIAWSYEYFKKNNERVVAMISSILNSQLELKSEEYSNLSLSEPAYKMLVACNGELAPGDKKKLKKFLLENLSYEKGYKRPRLFQDAEKEIMREKYRKDMGVVRNISGVEFVG